MIVVAVGYTRKGGTICIVGMPPSGAKAAFEGVSIADNAKKLIGSNNANMLTDWLNMTGHNACWGVSPSAISAKTLPRALLIRIIYKTSIVAALVLIISRDR